MVVACKECGKEIDKSVLICPHCETDQRSFFRQHKFLTGMLIVGIFGLIWVATFGSKRNPYLTPPNFPDATASDPQNPDKIRITAQELVAAYKTSEISANQAYKGKMAEISGKVAVIGSQSGRTYLVLSPSASYSLTNVQCFFNDIAEIGKVSNLKKDDYVTVSGLIEGKTLNIQVNNCILRTE